MDRLLKPTTYHKEISPEAWAVDEAKRQAKKKPKAKPKPAPKAEEASPKAE
jgi:hypothetical protein